GRPVEECPRPAASLCRPARGKIAALDLSDLSREGEIRCQCLALRKPRVAMVEIRRIRVLAIPCRGVELQVAQRLEANAFGPQPIVQPFPLAKQRLVRDLDGAAVLLLPALADDYPPAVEALEQLLALLAERLPGRRSSDRKSLVIDLHHRGHECRTSERQH